MFLFKLMLICTERGELLRLWLPRFWSLPPSMEKGLSEDCVGAGGEARDALCGGVSASQTPREPGFSGSSQLVAAWQHRRSEAFHTRPGHAPVRGSALRGRPPLRDAYVQVWMALVLPC